MLVHVALDVLDHDDRVVDDHADGQHQSEQREQVDREAQREHAGERRHQGDDDGHAADDRRAEALQEQVDDEHDQHHRLDQRLDHFLDRQPDEVVGVESDHVVHPLREPGFHLLQRLAHSGRYHEAVRARLLVDGDDRRRHPVHLAVDDVLLQSDLGARDVADADDRVAVLAGAQDDVQVLVGVGELRLGDHRKREFDRAGVWLLADLPGAEQLVLLADRVGDVGRRDR